MSEEANKIMVNLYGSIKSDEDFPTTVNSEIFTGGVVTDSNTEEIFKEYDEDDYLIKPVTIDTKGPIDLLHNT